ncbi:MAG: MaoC family dehydratase N-terminal domain-containing protein [Firmicutes bacterium]|nr:MaoC family dehydratase N-terminal domain-containing protein [Bacillota bacterium]
MKHLWDYQVNDPLPVREWYPNEMQFRQYAEVSGDFNPIHLDDAYARAAGLDGVIAHGMLIMAQVGAMLTDWMGDEGTLRSFEARFENMVFAGERIECSGYIKDVCSNALICDLMVINSKREKVLSGSAVVTYHTPKN